MKKKIYCLTLLLILQFVALWSCNMIARWSVVVIGVTAIPQTISYVDSVNERLKGRTWDLSKDLETLDTSYYYSSDSIYWLFQTDYELFAKNENNNLLTAFASTAYASKQIINDNVYPNKLVSRRIITIADYNDNYPAHADISAICYTNLDAPFNNISNAHKANNDLPTSEQYFILKEAPTDHREVILRIEYEFENNEIYHFTTTPLKMY